MSIMTKPQKAAKKAEDSVIFKTEIKSCEHCPFCEVTPDPTDDWFEQCFRWDCKKANKNVQRYVEWTDKGFIPDWCPLRKDEK